MIKKILTKKVFIIAAMLILIAFAGFAIEGLYFDEEGNVGIGATVPGQKLDVRGKIRTGDHNGNWDLWGGTNLVFQDDGVDRVFFAGNGNVGIGCSNPDNKLEIRNGNIELEYDNQDTQIRFHDPYNAWYSMGIDVSDGRKFKINYGSYVGELSHFTMHSNGNVGIGTNSPSTKLDVAGDIQFNSTIKTPGRMHITGGELCYILNKSGVVIGKEWGGNGNLTVQGNLYANKLETRGNGLQLSGGGWGVEILLDTDNDSRDHFLIKDGPNTHFNFEGNPGNLWIRGKYRSDSDIRYKKDINTIPNALDKITKLRGVNFKWKDRNDNGLQMGVIAQDVEKVFPELVSTNEDGYKSVAYSNLVGALIEAIKEQQKQIDELKGTGTHQEKNLWDKITGIFK